MPPRIPARQVARACRASPNGSTTLLQEQVWQGAKAWQTSTSPSLPAPQQSPRRSFSTSPSLAHRTKARKAMFAWLEGRGAKFHDPAPMNYVTNEERTPFPNNAMFKSENVLDDESMELIWHKVMVQGEPLKAVSAMYGVDVRRVAAVVRLKEVERRWETENKPKALLYARAVMKMLPRTNLPTARSPHESINDVKVHPYTLQQLFWPVPESKQFTRADAAKAFHRNLLPPDDRLPIPELVELEKDKLEGKPLMQSLEDFKSRVTLSEQQLAERKWKKELREARRVMKVDSDRFEFRFQKFEVEDVGKDGRSPRGTGWKYGNPLPDRKKGHIKVVPQKVGV